LTQVPTHAAPVVPVRAIEDRDRSASPTGGIGINNALAYLALPNVIVVGGSSVAPAAAIAAGDGAAFTKVAHQAAGSRLREGKGRESPCIYGAKRPYAGGSGTTSRRLENRAGKFPLVLVRNWTVNI